MRILVLGATSAIAHAAARSFARDNAQFVLAARDADKRAAVAADLRVHGAAETVEVTFDALDFSDHAAVVAQAWRAFDGLDVALLAWGTLPDASRVTTDADAAVEAFAVNATSVVSVLTLLANRFEAQGTGTIGIVSSVAGDRGRASNYVYGAAKGAVSLFAQGLRARLAGAGVRVVTIKPGFVDTPMTADLPKNPLFASPDAVGARIHAALTGRADVVYAPAFWRPVMAGVRAIPERLFKRLPL